MKFEDAEDAEAAQDNMHSALDCPRAPGVCGPPCTPRRSSRSADSELYGRVLTVNTARALSGKLGGSKAVWADADAWEARLKEDGLQTEQELAAAAADDAAVPFDTLTPGQPPAAAAGAGADTSA